MKGWHDSAENEAICKVEGVPRTDGEPISRREILSWQWFCQLIGLKVKQGSELGEEFLRAKVAQETNAAKKTAEEAAEIAARREECVAATDLKRQEAGEQFISNLKSLSELPPLQQTLALAKILQDNPEIASQLEKIEVTMERLRLLRGVKIELAPAAVPVEAK